MRPLFVGELNPYGTDPYFALFCAPKNSAGARLQRVICGLPRHEYLACPRVNLCDRVWSASMARARASELKQRHQDFVLLGRKVAAAFGFAGGKFFDFTSCLTSDAMGLRRYVILPHPSGRNPMWNDPGCVVAARETLAKMCPAVPWGSLQAAGG